MKINKQIVVITGGSSGIGRVCAEMLLERGLTVVIWDKVRCALDCFALQCDVSKAASVESAMEETLQQIGIPQICINCAGIAPAKKIVGKEGVMPLSDFQKVIDINLVGTFNVMRVIAATMLLLPESQFEEDRGVIINTASIAAYEGQIGQTAYSASKGGIVSLTLPAARELAQYGIRVNTIAPGLIETPLILNMPEEVQTNLKKNIPFPKRFGKPEEYGHLAIHIIENCLLNGEVIRLDGALRMSSK